MHYLPHLNATLNSVAAALLVAGYVRIRRRDEAGHKRLMLAAFATSVAFLTSYLIYHFQVPTKKFPASAPQIARGAYYGILISHILLAVTVPFLATAAIWLGWTGRRAAHRRVVRWAFPIWMYVSVTGVVVYVMLYRLYA